MSNNIELEIKELKSIIDDSDSEYEEEYDWGVCCFCKNKMSFDNLPALNGSNKVCMNCYKETRDKLIKKREGQIKKRDEGILERDKLIKKRDEEILRLKNKLSRVIRRLNSINEIINRD